MAKLLWKPSTQLAPVPVVMLSCQRPGGRPNIITVAWVGTVCSEPPLLGVAIRPERFSHDLIRDSAEFVVNLPTVELARATDYCGVVSGRDTDKFQAAGLTPAPAATVQAPLIAECPLHLECHVREQRSLGTHTLFLAEILAVRPDDRFLTASGRFALDRAGLITYAHGHYYALGRRLGHFGFAVRRRPRRRK